MKTLMTVVRRLAATCAVCLTVLLALSITPTDVEAQCSYCKFTGTGNECGWTGGGSRCSGGSHGWCEPCGWFAAAPSQLAPDGALHVAASTSADEILSHGEPLSSGVTVLRSQCNGAIIGRHYTEGSAAKIRKATAILALG